MQTGKIQVRNTEKRQLMEVVVLDKRASSIQVVLGTGVRSVKCGLLSTRNGLAYAGPVMGQESSLSAVVSRCRRISAVSIRGDTGSVESVSAYSIG
jgi:hypothetical protein